MRASDVGLLTGMKQKVQRAMDEVRYRLQIMEYSEYRISVKIKPVTDSAVLS
jgi:hypothetical protein